MLSDGLLSVDPEALDSAERMIVSALEQDQTIYVCGNGGSAAISDHFLCDHSKGIHGDTNICPRVVSLSSHTPLITAIANDMNYSDIFSYQLEMFGRKGDLLVVISSSGDSENIVRAIQKAKNRLMKTIAMVGFDGGRAGALADCTLHVKQQNYGVVEDCHQSLMHIIAQNIRVHNTYKREVRL